MSDKDDSFVGRGQRYEQGRIASDLVAFHLEGAKLLTSNTGIERLAPILERFLGVQHLILFADDLREQLARLPDFVVHYVFKGQESFSFLEVKQRLKVFLSNEAVTCDCGHMRSAHIYADRAKRCSGDFETCLDCRYRQYKSPFGNAYYLIADEIELLSPRGGIVFIKGRRAMFRFVNWTAQGVVTEDSGWWAINRPPEKELPLLSDDGFKRSFANNIEPILNDLRFDAQADPFKSQLDAIGRRQRPL